MPVFGLPCCWVWFLPSSNRLNLACCLCHTWQSPPVASAPRKLRQDDCCNSEARRSEFQANLGYNLRPDLYTQKRGNTASHSELNGHQNRCPEAVPVAWFCPSLPGSLFHPDFKSWQPGTLRCSGRLEVGSSSWKRKSATVSVWSPSYEGPNQLSLTQFQISRL